MEANKDNLEIAPAPRRRSPRNRFNPDMLATAREAQRLSQSELAEKMGVSQALIGKLESALGDPTEDQINDLARVLEVQPEIFFIDRSRRLASMSDFYHRALARAKRRDVKAIHARCSIFDIQIDRILNVGGLPEDQIPEFDPDDYPEGPERIAEMTREAMGIAAGPIPNLVEAIERSGAIVIDRQLEVDGVDALCRWVPELPKIFFLNGAKPADRIRFSLAHELGHTVMHFDRDFEPQDAEHQADSFASAFLMPANEIRHDFRGHVNISDLAAIKRKWRVSMQAAARRAFALKIIDKRRYQYLCVQMSRNGWRKEEPVSIEGESPTTFNRLLQRHLDAGYSPSDLAKLLLVSEASVDRMLRDAMSLPNFKEHGVRLRIIDEDRD